VAGEALLAAVGHAVSGVPVVKWAWEQIPGREAAGPRLSHGFPELSTARSETIARHTPENVGPIYPNAIYRGA